MGDEIELLLGLPAVGDIAVGAALAQELARRVENRLADMLDPAFAPVAGLDAEGQRFVRDAARTLGMIPPGSRSSGWMIRSIRPGSAKNSAGA